MRAFRVQLCNVGADSIRPPESVVTHGESRESGALHVEMSLDQGGGGGGGGGADASSGWWDGVGSMGGLMEGKGGAGAGTGGRERENRKSRAEVSVVGLLGAVVSLAVRVREMWVKL